LPTIYRRVAYYVALNGTKPTDLPIERRRSSSLS
jgi:hypothetical protein